MTLYEVLSLTVSTVAVVIAVLAYLNDRNNKRK